jgi:hypothetical protein
MLRCQLQHVAYLPEMAAMLLLALRHAPADEALPFVMGIGTGLVPVAAPAAAGRSTEEYLSSSSICKSALASSSHTGTFYGNSA